MLQQGVCHTCMGSRYDVVSECVLNLLKGFLESWIAETSKNALKTGVIRTCSERAADRQLSDVCWIIEYCCL